MSEAVTVSSLMMMTSIVSEEWFVRDTHTQTQTQTQTQRHTHTYTRGQTFVVYVKSCKPKKRNKFHKAACPHTLF